MNIELLIIYYGAVCLSMIIFNCACIYVFKMRDKRTHSVSKRLANQIHVQINEMKYGHALGSKGMAKLERKLKKVNCLMSFDLAVEELLDSDREATKEYIKAIHPVFLHLGYTYLNKETTQGVYLLHVMEKYHVCSGIAFDLLADLMLEYCKKPGIYCRSRALEVLCQAKNTDKLVAALAIIDRQNSYFPDKLTVALLLSFEGDSEKLIQLLIERFHEFSLGMQVAIINYISQIIGESSNKYNELFYNWLMNAPEDELHYALLRYFGAHPYEPVREYLYSLIDSLNTGGWISALIAATVLSSYPGDRTVLILKRGLSSRNWYVRYNSAESLEKLGITYNELSAILTGTDRYACEMITYRTEHNNLMKEAALL